MHFPQGVSEVLNAMLASITRTFDKERSTHFHDLRRSMSAFSPPSTTPFPVRLFRTISMRMMLSGCVQAKASVQLRSDVEAKHGD